MQFESVTPSIVRSIRQRDLLNAWLRLRASCGGLPPLADYRPVQLSEELQDIVYYLVKPRAAGFQFIIDSHGSRLSYAYGKVGESNVGKDLREYVGARLADLLLPIYERCAERTLPVYSISLVEDMNGRAVHYERLLMPFSTDGQTTHIIASLKTISEAGKFEINNLMRNRGRLPEYKLRAVIDHQIAGLETARDARGRSHFSVSALASDVVEI